MSVLCLIANPQTPALTSQIVQAIHREIGGEINWLAQTIACEIIAPKSTSSIEIATQAVNTLPVDVVMVPRTNRRKKLLLADMDSTMIEQECIDELADALGLKPEISAITERAMRGELDFSEALETRVALLKGLDLDVIKQVRRQAITLSPGGRVLVKTMQEYGAYTSLVSGGFTLFADYFARRIGFDEAIANMLEMDENQKLTGTVSLPIVDSETKVSRLRTLVSQLKITTADAVTVGDGANDLPMLQAAGLGVALHAKPAVAAAAPYCIRHGDLTALLYLQGFNEEEFVR